MNESWGGWFNLGFWDRARTFPDACADLARALGEHARLAEGQAVLDVGCGSGESLALWLSEYAVARVDGVEIDAARAAHARRALAERGLSEHVRIRVGSATALGDLPGGSYDRVVCLDSAYHHRAREDFFREASRVLRAGGRLATADLVFPGGAHEAARALVSRACAIPAENMVDAATYRAQLERAGFASVTMRALDRAVLDGFARAALSPGATVLRAVPVRLWPMVLVTGLSLRVPAIRGAFSFVLVGAEKQA